MVDDLLGIVVIALFYADGLAFGWLGASAAAISVFGYLVRRSGTPAAVLIVVAVAAWD